MTAGTTMRRRALMTGAVLAIAAPLAAQQVQVAGESQQQRYQMQTFEAVLESAVRHGGDAFARQAAESVPAGVQLTSADPQAKGFIQPAGGVLFVVVVPPIRQAWMYVMTQRPPMAQPSVSNGAPSNGGVRAASNLVQADPMTPPAGGEPAAQVAAPPDVAYTRAVVEALEDAMLDNAGPLPLKDDDFLTVAAIDTVGTSPTVVNSPYDSTTYLEIKGGDLARFRQQKVTREEARKLIVVEQK